MTRVRGPHTIPGVGLPTATPASLGDRRALVLALVVREHVRNAQPVASSALARRYRLGCSPATIRAEMAALEDAGLLTHPHTSAGRVPTIAGYRFFVEHLMTRAGLAEGDRRAIRRQFRHAGWEPERWMRLSAAVMARLSGAAGLVAVVPAAVARPSRLDDDRRIYHAGLAQILDEPEFADTTRLRGVVEILENGQGLAPICADLPREGVRVLLGGEPPLEDVPHITLVLARFGDDAEPGGVLGVVGPTRMAYERAVPAVGYVARLMRGLLAGQPV